MGQRPYPPNVVEDNQPIDVQHIEEIHKFTTLPNVVAIFAHHVRAPHRLDEGLGTPGPEGAQPVRVFPPTLSRRELGEIEHLTGVDYVGPESRSPARGLVAR
jgi:hypothetical protein